MRARWLALGGVALAAVVAPARATTRVSPRVPAVTGHSYILVDPVTGAVLAARHPELRMPMASVTKLMTALVAVEHASLNAKVDVTTGAAATSGSSMHLIAGERIAMRNLLKGLLIASGNDAAIAIADGISGSVPRFVALMNRRARALGMTDTHFENPDGLDYAHHFTSARDLVLIGRQVAANPVLERILKTRRAVVPGPNGIGGRVLISQDGALGSWAPIDVIKTGRTHAAGGTVVCRAVQPGTGVQLWVAELGAPSVAGRSADVEKLIGWGFRHYSRTTVLSAGAPEGTIPVTDDPRVVVQLQVARELVSVIRVDMRLTRTIRVAGGVSLPVAEGQVLGTITVRQGAHVLGVRSLVARAAVNPSVGTGTAS
jgi:D-alanyl-D-alanine carboxypeptidase (penicillin-binding protein 5/6)